MANGIDRKPIVFMLVALVVILIGTFVTMFYPMMTAEMHPRLENLKPYTALELAGKDIYQREGCVGCHTQTVRPLKTEVLRYGEYSKAGEFAYDRPFLWGSKRTGPDLARVGGKYPDAWHSGHMTNPRDFFPKSNMPSYAFLNEGRLNPADIQAHMEANGFPYTDEEILALSDRTEMDAIIAYMQSIGRAVTGVAQAEASEAVPTMDETMANPLAGDQAAKEAGEKLYGQHCVVCHGEKGQGGIGPSLVDGSFQGTGAEGTDAAYFTIISVGTQTGMPPYGGPLGDQERWSLVTYIRHLQQGE